MLTTSLDSTVLTERTSAVRQAQQRREPRLSGEPLEPGAKAKATMKTLYPHASKIRSSGTAKDASMIYLLVLLPATGLTIAGYFALFLSGRSEGRMRTFGRYLGYWAFMLAALLVLGGIFAAGHHRHQCPMWMHGMHERPADAPSDAPATPR